MKNLTQYYGKEIIHHLPATVMSGVESDSYWDICLDAGFDRVLMSYHYLKTKPKRMIAERMKKRPDVKIMIDSGAYTFHDKEEEYKDKPWEFWEKYATDYTNFIRANKEHIFCCVELDIANLVGFDKQDYIRKTYFDPLKEEGILVCYVWHEYDGEPFWEEMCKRYDFVAFSLQNSSSNERNIMKRINIARRYGALVHGLACTRLDYQVKYPFFSVDSTTWLVGTQYGEMNYFDGRKMKRLKKADWKTVYKPKLIKLGANWDLAEEENPYELIRLNALTFKQAENYVHKRIRGKVYWYDAIHGGSKEPKKTIITPKSIRGKKPSLQTEGEGKAVVEKPKKKIIIKKKPKKKVIIKKKKAPDVLPDVVEQPDNRMEELKQLSTPEGASDVFSKGEGHDQQAIVPVLSSLDLEPGKELSKYERYQLEQAGEKPSLKDFDTEIFPYIPVSEWWEQEEEIIDRDWKFIARTCGIHIPEKDTALDILFYATLLFKDGDPFEEDLREGIHEYSMALFGEEGDSDDYPSILVKLSDYFRKNMSGEEKGFLPEEETFGAMERPKERDEYLVDEEFEGVDLTPQEEMELARFLPAPTDAGTMSDEDLDRELSKQGMIAVRDEKGRFLKGQKKVRKPKSLGSKHFPKLACNTCYKAGECPEYKPDHACAFDKIFKKFKTRNTEDVLDAMHGMADLNMERMSRLAFFETMDGGMPDPTLTSMIDQNINILTKMKQLQDSQVMASQRRVMRTDGTMEETTTVHGNPRGGSILEKLFGGGVDDKEGIEDAEIEDL